MALKEKEYFFCFDDGEPWFFVTASRTKLAFAVHPCG